MNYQHLLDLWQPLLGATLVIGLWIVNARDINILANRIDQLEKQLRELITIVERRN